MRVLLIGLLLTFTAGCWGDIEARQTPQVPFEAKGKEAKELLIKLEKAPPEKAKKYQEHEKKAAEGGEEAGH